MTGAIPQSAPPRTGERPVLDGDAFLRQHADADPTEQATAKFSNPALWQVRENVPIFDEHDEYEVPTGQVDAKGQPITTIVYVEPGEAPPPGGKLVRHFGPDELAEIADHCNLREEATGDACPVTIGHTIAGAPESQQPEIVGYARFFHLGRFGPLKKLAILVTKYFYRDKYATAMQYPRRSVELWKADNIIDPIALLKRTPQRDLGLLTASRGGIPIRYAAAGDRPRAGRLYYSMEEAAENSSQHFSAEDKDMDPQQDTAAAPPPAAPPAAPPDDQGDAAEDAAVIDKLAKHFVKRDDQVFKYMCDKFAAEQPPPAADASGAPAAPPAAAAAPPQPPVQHAADAAPPPAAGAGMPAGGNTFIPGSGAGTGPPPEKKPYAREEQRMAAESEAIKYARMQARVDELERRDKENSLRYRKAEAEKVIGQLEYEGYELDRAYEVEQMIKLDEAGQTSYAGHIRKHYRRAPTDHGGIIPIGRLGDDGEKKTYSREQVNKAVEMVTASNGKLTYEEALAKVG